MYARRTPICTAPKDVESFNLILQAQAHEAADRPMDALPLYMKAAKLSDGIAWAYRLRSVRPQSRATEAPPVDLADDTPAKGDAPIAAPTITLRIRATSATSVVATVGRQRTVARAKLRA